MRNVDLICKLVYDFYAGHELRLWQMVGGELTGESAGRCRAVPYGECPSLGLSVEKSGYIELEYMKELGVEIVRGPVQTRKSTCAFSLFIDFVRMV